MDACHQHEVPISGNQEVSLQILDMKHSLLYMKHFQGEREI